MRKLTLTDIRWHVSDCGQPVGVTYPTLDGPGITVAGPTRQGYLWPVDAWSRSDAERILCHMHQRAWHPSALYLG